MKTYVWALPTRLFHWMLFISLVAAYLINEDEFLNLHVSFGYIVLILLLFRLIYGLIGPAYARFKDFPIFKIRGYLTNWKIQDRKYPGHNPASAIIMMAILINIVLVGISGMLTLSAKGYGLFKGIVLQGNENRYKELHELLVNVLIILVIIHLAGLVVDFYRNHRVGTLKSIFTGYKNIEGKSIKESRGLNVLLSLFIVGALFVFSRTVSANFAENDSTEQYEEDEDED